MRLPIPGTNGYEISDDSVVYRKDGTVATTYRNGDGYVTTLIITDTGDFVTVGVHRLVAMTFKSEDRTPEKTHVNHLDGDKENNLPSNVDWETPANNNLHASLMRIPGRPNSLVLTGEKTGYFPNLQEAATFLKCTIAEAWFMVRDKIARDGCLLLINRGLGPEFHQVKIKTRDALGRQPPRMLKMRSLDTGEEFAGYGAQLARVFNVSTAHITTSVSNETIRIFKNDWIIVDADSDYPEITPSELEELRSRGKPKEVWCYDRAKNHLEIFPSAASFVKQKAMSKKAVTTRLKKNGFGSIDDLVFCYGGVLSFDAMRFM